MVELRRVGDLEIAEGMDAQRRNWKFQRIGTVVMALVVARLAQLARVEKLTHSKTSHSDDVRFLPAW